MTPESLRQSLEDFLAPSSTAVVVEDGGIVFDLTQSKYSILGEYNKCLLHLWSSERNIIRCVLDTERKGETLRMTVQRMGQSRPTKLDICRQRDRRTASAKRVARASYRRVLERVLLRHFPEFTALPLSNAVDLEKSFGPIYARGLLKRGQSAFAVLGVSGQELQTSIDAALTFGILWLDVCRHRHGNKTVVEGLRLFVPNGCSALVSERMANLNGEAAKWFLYELDERSEEIRQVEIGDRGNISTRLARRLDEAGTHTRFADAIALVRSLMPEVEAPAISAAEISFRCHGLEFARARLTAEPGKFRGVPEIVFGVGTEERVLDSTNFPAFEKLIASVGELRHAEGPREERLWRLHPERWLESLVTKNLNTIDHDLDPKHCYSQVPAFSASDRAMIDVLTVNRNGRLTVLELKADEDIHLPLQGIDYWSRVAWHHERGEFQKYGYFPGRELSLQPPSLIMVAPALHIHPATDTLLRYISSDIEWLLLGIDERWRKGLRVVFRKRSALARLSIAV